MSQLLRSTGAILCCLALAGCMDLLRRQPVVTTVEPDWRDGNPAERRDVQQVEKTPSRVEEVRPPVQMEQLVPPKSSRQRTKRIEKVNKYALWCVENDLWKEAQLHLERALVQDSLAASIRNNLGIIYERLGRQQDAALEYAKAQMLNSQKEAYRINLKRLENWQQDATSDSTRSDEEVDQIDLFTDPRRPPQPYGPTGG